MRQPYCTEVEDWHIHYVANNMRQADIDELWAQSMSRPLNSLQYAVRVSTSCWTIMSGDDEPVGLFGVGAVSMIGGIGSPWMLSTDGLLPIAKSFLKGCPEYIEKMLNDFDKLQNVIDTRNTVSIRWLKWLGFDMLDPQPYGPFQVPFHVFKMERENPCVNQ